MKIAYKHLIEAIPSRPSIEDISQKLFQLGHENEIHNDILDIEITPNRGDCLSVNGILRELNLFYDIDFNKEVSNSALDKLALNFKNKAEDCCPYISFLHIEVDEIPLNYNESLESYFKELKINKNNFFADVSNFVSYETGQPTHSYDYSKLQSDQIILNLCEEPISFKTLHGNEINLSGENLVFYDKNESVINLAGIMGGDMAACSKNTKSVIVECAFFNPEIIIGKSVKYDIQSDAAYKYERGVDPNCHDYVLRRFLKIVEEHTKVINASIFTSNSSLFSNTKVAFDNNKINKIIGTNLTQDKMVYYLNKLGFQYNENNLITVPSYRNDINSLNDISEEIARCIGYDNIPLNEIKINSIKKINQQIEDEHKLKNFLIENGFYEVINNPFIRDKCSGAIELDNPLDSNRKYLRTSLKNNLIDNLLYNERRQKDSIKLFEISNIYKSHSDISSERYLGIIASGRVANNYLDFSKKINKSFVLNILNKISPNVEVVHQDVDRKLLDSKLKSDISYVEVKLDNILQNNLLNNIENYSPRGFIKYKQISDYPSSIRDLSFAIKDISKYKNLEKFIKGYSNKILKEVFIFDFYNNEKINEIKIGFRFIFQSPTKTITDKDVAEVMNEIINYSTAIESVSIPGLD